MAAPGRPGVAVDIGTDQYQAHRSNRGGALRVAKLELAPDDWVFSCCYTCAGGEGGFSGMGGWIGRGGSSTGGGSSGSG
jgi:uncharacterized membrane protein YgcG